MKTQNRRLSTNRRQFLKRGAVFAGAAGIAGTLAAPSLGAAARDEEGQSEPTGGDVAILRFLAAAEIIETDLWQQYRELGGVEAPPSGYTGGLAVLDGDMSQYISDNTDDEISHAQFLNAYLVSKGENPVNLDAFRTLPSSPVTSNQILRLTNLMNLTVDTSWWTRYRSPRNPDFGATFPNIVPALAVGQHTAIPLSDADLLGDPNDLTTIPPHVQAIANTAAFHFAFIEQGGSSLYATMAQKVTSLEVLRIVVSIGPTETSHFQTWHDKAGNAPPVSDGDLVFPDLGSPEFEDDPAVKKNLIMPEPCAFLRPTLPLCSVVRPTAIRGVAMGAVRALTNDGLFIGQSREFFEALHDLAADADRARRDG